jgi:hypothetical protein
MKTIDIYDPRSLKRATVTGPTTERFFAKRKEDGAEVEITAKQAKELYDQWGIMLDAALARRTKAMTDIVLFGQSFREADEFDQAPQ